MKKVIKKWICLSFFFCFTSIICQAQDNFTGTVVDSTDKTPLPGASVTIKGSNTGGATDTEGKFSLPATTESAVLIISMMGFDTKEVSVQRGQNITISMSSGGNQALEEVVVVGYGTQRKVNLTGAVGTADGEVLENRPISNVAEGLQGVIPNLNVSPRNGDPSRSTEFNVRGYESINGGSPLILVDGVPMDLNRVNPSDIESISVLKDASASAIYGARAAFGVVLVETKSGKEGKLKVSLNTQWSLANPILNLDIVEDPYEVVTAWNTASMRTNGTPRYDEDMVEGTKAWSENPDTAPEWGVVDGDLRYYGSNNYQDRLMIDFAPTHQHNATVSGGSENANYYVSLGHMSKDGYLAYNNEKFKRYNILMKGEFKLNDWLSLDEKVVVNIQKSNKPHFYNWDVNINSLARVSPTRPIQFPDLDHYLESGDHDQFAQYIGKYFGGTNFFPYLLDGGRTTFTNNDTWLTTGATLTPLEGLKIRADLSYNIFQRDFRDVASKVEIVSTDLTSPEMISNGFSGNDWIREESTNNHYYVFNTFAEYTYDKLEDHHIKAMAGFNQEWGRNKFTLAQAYSLISPKITNIKATIGNQETGGSGSEVALRGAFYRLNYSYKDRYLIETNGRYDGSSRFPKESRFGFFPSVSVGWRISNEPFMEGMSDWLDNLKVRASYGTLGNQLLTQGGSPLYYPYISTLGIGTSPYLFSDSRIPMVSAPGLVSSALTWETVVSKNIGLDILMLNSRLEASLDVYTRDTRDMLMDVEYPAILGAEAPKSNAADLRTNGWELSLSWKDQPNDDWDYSVGLALSDWTAEITKYDNPTGALSEHYVGKKLGEIWGYETVGIFQTEEEVENAADQSQLGANWRPGDIHYADLNGDDTISTGSNTLSDPGDRKVIGNSNPRFTFGLNTGVGYKGFRLSAFFQGYVQRDHWPSEGSWTWFFPFNAGHIDSYFISDSWSEDNRDAYFAAPHISSNDKKNIQPQSRFLQNAAYVRLKNLTLSYDLPTRLLEQTGLGQARIYLTGMNIWEYSPIRKPLDPETIYAGAVEYPLQRLYSLGLSVTF